MPSTAAAQLVFLDGRHKGRPRPARVTEGATPAPKRSPQPSLHHHPRHRDQRLDAVADRVVERAERYPRRRPHALVAQVAQRPEAAELGFAFLDPVGERVGHRRGVVVQLWQQAGDVGVDVLDVALVGRPSDVALAVLDLGALQQPRVAVGAVAHVDRHPGPIDAVLRAGPLQHLGDQVLPGAAPLVRRLHRADVVAGTAIDSVPRAVGRRRVGEGPLGHQLAHGIALAAIGRALGVHLVGIAVLVEHRPARHLLQVHLRDHRGHAGGDHHAAHRARAVHAGDDVVAGAAHVVLVVVAADVADVGDAVAALEDLVEAAFLVEVGAVHGEAAGGVGRHRLQEAGARIVGSSALRTQARTR